MSSTHPEVAALLTDALKKAKSFGSRTLDPEHIMLTVLESPNEEIEELYKKVGADLDEMYSHLYKICIENNTNAYTVKETLPSAEIKKIFEYAHGLADRLGEAETRLIHIVVCISRFENYVTTYLNKNSINYHKFITIMTKDNIKNAVEDFGSGNIDNPMGKKGRPKKGDGKHRTPILDSFCRDISKLAEEDKLDPVIGRDPEIEDICRILGRRKKNNPVIIGEPGTGKSAIAEGLAIKIKEGKVPNLLVGKKIFSLDMSSVIAGTKYRGQFEERMQALIKEIQDNEDVILFIDELHTIVGAGNANGSLDAANIFKPALSRGELQVIGATTLKEYREHIEKDTALTRRFQKVVLEEPSEDESIVILNNIKDKYEDYHSVEYTDEAIEACVRLSKRYITDRFLPDKAIDIMDEAGSLSNISIKPPKKVTDLEQKIIKTKQEKKLAVKKQLFEDAAQFRDKETALKFKLDETKKKWLAEIKKNRTVIHEDMITSIISKTTGIPVSKMDDKEMKKFSNIETQLKKSVIGQDDAINKVASAIKVSRLGLKSPNRPIGTFMFLGVTGTGKTHLTKMLSKHVYGDESALIRVDMSEFSEKFSASRLIGPPPGYVGYEEGGQLTEQVRRKPHSVILFDEIEKAHKDIYSLLLQILDEGHVTDSLGRKIDFKNTLIILTSNTGVKVAQESGSGIGFQTDSSVLADNMRAEQIISKEVKKKFPPEFLNRLDDIIFFKQLTEKDVEKIISIECKDLFERFDGLGYEIKLTKSAISFLTKEGYDPNYGARPLKRAISQYIEKPIASKIVDGEATENSTVKVTHRKDSKELAFSFAPKAS